MQKGEEDSRSNSQNVVCPESTLESANQRNLIRKAAPNKEIKNNNNTDANDEFICESTIESSLRRDFIRKAALTTAAAGIGATFLGKNSLIPQSSASSAGCVSGTNIKACCNVFVDTKNTNNGKSLCPGYRFGCGGGEGIASARANCSPNQYGLDFYTQGKKRISVTNSGNVGINNTSPSGSAALCVESLSSCSTSAVAVQAYASKGTGVSGFSNCGVGAFGGSSNNVGVWGETSGGTGVVGRSCGSGIGVCAISFFGLPIQGRSYNPLIGKFKNISPSGDKTALAQFEAGDSTVADWNLGAAGACNPCSIPDGVFFIGQPSKGAKVVVNSSGNVGVGTTSPATTLQINGSVSVAKIKNVTSTYAMTTSDFAILADATNGGFTVTLPSASTSGMIVYIKRIDGIITNILTVQGSGSDKIEGGSSKSLGKKFASLTLLANGSNTWLIIAKDV